MAAGEADTGRTRDENGENSLDVIAFAEIFLTYAYKKFFSYILPETLEPNSLVQLLSTDYKFAISFSILVIVLLFRPSGIFEGKKI